MGLSQSVIPDKEVLKELQLDLIQGELPSKTSSKRIMRVSSPDSYHWGALPAESSCTTKQLIQQYNINPNVGPLKPYAEYLLSSSWRDFMALVERGLRWESYVGSGNTLVCSTNSLF